MSRDGSLPSLVKHIMGMVNKPCTPCMHAIQVNVYPLESEKAKAVVAATHTKKPKEGVPSRRERRLAEYKGGCKWQSTRQNAVPWMGKGQVIGCSVGAS